MLKLFAAENVDVVLTAPVNAAPLSDAPPRLPSAPVAVVDPVPPAEMGTALMPDTVVPVVL
jgi:hypothetical protein